MPNYGYTALAPASGVARGIEQVLKQRMLEQEMQLAERRQQQAELDTALRMQDARQRRQDAIVSANAAAEKDRQSRLWDASKLYAQNAQPGASIPDAFNGLPPVRPEFNVQQTTANVPGMGAFTMPSIRAYGAGGPKPTPQKLYPVTVAGPGGKPQDQLFTEDQMQKGVPKWVAPKEPKIPDVNPADTMLPPDPASQNILSQTGLSLNAFRVLTGQGSQLPRDQNTRNRAAKEAQDWARSRNVDVSTLASQYKTYNDVLASNISRLNNTKIMESELEGTIDNLRSVVRDADLKGLRYANVAKVWAGQEVNDPLAQQYALHLGQLRNELSAYYAATQGRTGNNITLQDQRDAEGVIRNGISEGSLDGLANAIKSSTGKMDTVMRGSVNRAQQSVWGLFGVGQNFNPGGAIGGASTGSTTGKRTYYDANGNVIR